MLFIVVANIAKSLFETNSQRKSAEYLQSMVVANIAKSLFETNSQQREP